MRGRARMESRWGRFLFTLAAVVLLPLTAGNVAGQVSEEEIAALQVQGEEEGWTFTVGPNPATERSLADLCGFVVPPNWQQTAQFDEIQPLAALPASFDWRTAAGCPPIRDQGNCGSCWAFSTIGALECAIRVKDGIDVNLSEQWLVSCNSDGWGCNGGFMAHDYLQWKTDPCGGTGAVLESTFPYVASKVACSCPYPHDYRIASWAYIGNSSSVPSVAAIKQAILDYGPISVAVYVSSAFQSYTSGVFNSCTASSPNHAVVLVGWDDTQGPGGVWILRNSWGSGWGESGYMRIAYNCSNVGYGACYVNYIPADDLRVTPGDDFGSSGKVGGPFLPANKTYTLSNTGASPLSWTAGKTKPWMDLSATSGTLAPGATATVVASLNASASSLAGGLHDDTITFTNATTSASQTRRAKLTVEAPASGLPFSEDFEGGVLQPYWRVTGTNEYRTQVTTANGPHGGTKHLTMDDTTDYNTYSRNELTLCIDLSGYERVVLSFWARGWDDDPHGPPPSPFTGGADFDGVAISADGNTWYEVQPLRGLGSTYTQYTVDLDAALAAKGLSYSSTFRLRFNQYDNYPITTDGIGIDDIQITGVLKDDLTVTPSSGFAPGGSQGGPFTPEKATYTLTNSGAASLDWTAVDTQAWVDVTPAGGTLAAGASATVDVSLNDDAKALSAGLYQDTVTFTNTVSGNAQTRSVALRVSGPCPVPPAPAGPAPADAATDVALDAELSWSSLADALGPGRSPAERQALLEAAETVTAQGSAGSPTISEWPAEQIEALSAGSVQILAFKGHSDNAAGGEYENTINAIRQHFSDFTVTATTTESAAGLASALAGKQVFLIPEQQDWTPSEMASWGTSIATVLQAFVDAGGVVIVADDGDGGNSALFVNNTGLMTVTGSTGPIYNDRTCAVTLASHPIMAGVPATFVATNGNTTFSGATNGTVLATLSGSSSPIVLAREVGLGGIVLMGWDYFSYNSDLARVIANAVQWQPNGPICTVTYDVYFGTSNPPTAKVGSDLDKKTCKPGALAANTTYYWKVVAKSPAGQAEGPVWSFTTIDIPAPPVPANPNPADGATDVSMDTDLAWNVLSAAGAASAAAPPDGKYPQTTEPAAGGADAGSPSVFAQPQANSLPIRSVGAATKVFGVLENTSGSTDDFAVTHINGIAGLSASPLTWATVTGSTGAALRASFDVIYFPVDSGSSYSNLRAAVAAGQPLSEFASLGGVLVLNLAGNSGNQADVAPGGCDYMSGGHNAETFASATHPYVTGVGYGGTPLTESMFANWGSTDHARLDNLPAGATSILLNSDGVSMAEYAWGSGKVIVSTLTFGWLNVGAEHYGPAFANELLYAASSGSPSHPTTYDVYFGTSDPPTTKIGSDLSAATCDPGTLVRDTRYYWKVVARNAAGTTDGPVWSFTTQTCPLPSAPANPAPADGATNVATDSVLKWNLPAPADDAAGQLAASEPTVDPESDPAAPAVPGVPGVPGFVPDAVFEAGGDCFNFGSNMESFNGTSRLRATVISVASEQTLSEIRMPLSFTGSANLYFYVFEASTQAGPYSAVLEKIVPTTGTGPTSYSSGPVSFALKPGKFYGIGVAWQSAIVSYHRTSASLPVAWPKGTIVSHLWQNVAPPYGSPISELTPAYIYQMEFCFGAPSPSCPTTYDVYFGTANPPTTKVAGDLATTEFDPGGLDLDKTYYWKVVAKNAGGQTPGPVWRFTTQTCPLPPAPANPDPADGTKNVPQNANLSWGSSSLLALGPSGEDILDEGVNTGPGSVPTLGVTAAEPSLFAGPRWLVVGPSTPSIDAAALAEGATVSTTTNFATASLTGMDVVIFYYSSDGKFTRDAATKAKLTAFVSAGGGLYVELGGGGMSTGNNYSWVPTDGVTSTPVNSPSSDSLSITEPSHPIAAGVTDSGLDHWVYSSHGDFTATGGLSVVFSNTNTGKPVTLAGTYGAGHVVYTSVDPTYAHSGPTLPTQRLVLGNALRFVGAGQTCPTHYDVFFGTDNPPTTKIAGDLTVTTCDPGNLAENTKYFWKVVAKNGSGETEGPVWSFTTVPDFDYQIVIRQSPSAADSGSLPACDDQVAPDKPFYVEFWAQDAGKENTGLSCVFADMVYDAANVNILEVGNTPVFDQFSSGTDDGNGRIDEIGGCTFSGAVGVEPGWVCVARVKAIAPFACDRTATEPVLAFALQPASGESSAYGRGAVQPAQIGYGVESVQVKPYTSVYDLSADGFVNAADVGILAPSWLKSQGSPGFNPDADFDCSGTVAGGDIGYFATAWLKACADGSVVFPPCRTCSGLPSLSAPPQGIQYALRLTETAPDQGAAGLLPAGLASIRAGQTVYAQFWVRDVRPESLGVVAAFADLSVPADQFQVLGILPGAQFSLFASGDPLEGKVGMLGGAATEMGTAAGEWVLVAAVELQALADTDDAGVGLAPCEIEPAARYGEGAVAADAIRIIANRPGGDVNTDGSVDVTDLLYLADSWALSAGQPGFDSRCDFNGDGSVDVTDLLTLAENWGI